MHKNNRLCKHRLLFFVQSLVHSKFLLYFCSKVLRIVKDIEKAIQNRTMLLVGEQAMEAIAAQRVIIFGVGGVGSWCAESLVRSGIRRLTIVDSDRVCITNVNRQLMATTKTIGRVKVEALRERLLEINPEAEIEAVQEIFNAETAEQFHLDEYDYIIDAIDSLKDKMELIVRATSRSLTRPKLYSSMGAALKMDPTKIQVSEFWKVNGCPLAAALRYKMRHQKRLPGRKFQCVWSPEVLSNLGQAVMDDDSGSMFNKAQINGSLAHITAIYGFTIAGLIIQDIYDKTYDVLGIRGLEDERVRGLED